MHAVGQQHDVTPAFQIDPQRRTGEAQVPDRVAGHTAAGGRGARRGCVPAEGPRRLRDRAVAPPELPDERRGKRPGLAAEAGEEHGRQCMHVGRVAEESGMPGHAAHCPGVVVVHLAHQHLPAPRTALGRRDGVGYDLQPLAAEPRQVDEVDVPEPEGPKDTGAHEVGQRLVRRQLHQLAEHDEAEVAIDGPRAERVLGPLAVHGLVDEVARAARADEVRAARALDAPDVLEEGPPRGQPRAVRQQMPDGDAVLPVDGEPRHETAHALVEPERTVTDEQHDGQRRREGLGQRREIEDRLFAHRRYGGLEAPVPDGQMEEHVVPARDERHRPGERACLDAALEHGHDPPHLHRRYATAGSHARSRPPSASSSTSTPKGNARFSTFAALAEWPAAKPNATGYGLSAKCSRTTSRGLTPSCAAHVSSVPKTTPATPSSAPACRSWRRSRSRRYACSFTSSRNRMAPRVSGALPVPRVEASTLRHPPMSLPDARPGRTHTGSSSSKRYAGSPRSRSSRALDASERPRAMSSATIGPCTALPATRMAGNSNAVASL